MKPIATLLEINLTDAKGSARSYRAVSATLDCGAGAIDFHAGCSSYSRGFAECLLTIFNNSGKIELKLLAGTASLTPTVLHILCESFHEQHPTHA